MDIFYDYEACRLNASCGKTGGKLKPHYSAVYFLDYCGRRTGVWDLCIIARGLLSEFVIQPLVYSTKKPNTVGRGNPIWRKVRCKANSKA